MSSLFLLFCVGCLGVSQVWSTSPDLKLENAEELFEEFIQKHGRSYFDDENEKQIRFQIFKENLQKAIQMNEKSEHAVFGITKFMDLTHEEFRNMYTGLRNTRLEDIIPVCDYLSDDDIPDVNAPESFDWREQNAVTRVKNQEDCGSCFAFSATGNIEGQYAIKYKQQIEVSEQQIVDCDDLSKGCQGGLMSYAFRSIIDMGGAESESDYPYTAQDDQCQFDPTKVKIKLADCRSYNLTSQEKLKQLVYSTGPISIGVSASGFSLYKEGILSDDECWMPIIDHGVLIVGYGVENGTPYWIVKNSWGDFGEDGYIRIIRGEGHTSCYMLNILMATSILA